MCIAILRDFGGQLAAMSQNVSIILDDEVLEFVNRLASDRSSFINDVLWQEKKRIFAKELEEAYEDQANNLELQTEMAAWDIAAGDGLNWQ